MEKSILVIVVTYNGEKWINRCLDSVIGSDYNNIKTFVVDNNSTDGTLSIIKSSYKDVVLAESDKNLGFGAANNIGFDYAIENGYDYLYLLNQDAWVMPDTFTKLVDAHSCNSDCGIISPLQTNAAMDALDRGFSTSLAQNSDILSDYLFGRARQFYQVDFVMAAHWLVSRECVLKVGKFSPVFSHYGEDDNYIDRAKYHGYKIGVATNTMAVHDREFRAVTKEKDIYFLTVAFRIVASNINNSFLLAATKACVKLFTSAADRSLKYKNITILFSAMLKIFELGKIYRDRKRNRDIFRALPNQQAI